MAEVRVRTSKTSSKALSSAYVKDPDNIELSYRLFKKYIQRGDFKGIMSIGRKILDRPDLSKDRAVSDNSSKDQVTIYDDTRRHIRVTIHRSSRENILKTVPEFPEVKFSERVYKFVARTYISELESKEAERFFEDALTHYPGSSQLKTLYLEWRNKRVFNR